MGIPPSCWTICLRLDKGDLKVRILIGRTAERVDLVLVDEPHDDLIRTEFSDSIHGQELNIVVGVGGLIKYEIVCFAIASFERGEAEQFGRMFDNTVRFGPFLELIFVLLEFTVTLVRKSIDILEERCELGRCRIVDTGFREQLKSLADIPIHLSTGRINQIVETGNLG